MSAVVDTHPSEKIMDWGAKQNNNVILDKFIRC